MAKKTNKLKQRLTNKYRLVVLNEETYEERFSFKLSRLNVYVFSGVSIITLVLLTALLISFTPLREYIPGYSSTNLRRRANNLSDSIQLIKRGQYANELKLMALMKVLNGEVGSEEGIQENIDSILKANKEYVEMHGAFASKSDSIFREDIDSQDRYDVNSTQTVEIGTVLFAPVTGTISDSFNKESAHYAVDIAVKKNTPIKAVADGTVIFSEWSATTGFVVIIKHSGDLLSVYKHSSRVYKHQGDLVKSGEVIAAAGSGGTLSTGTHLHFELWYNGYPIDPTNFIDFE